MQFFQMVIHDRHHFSAFGGQGIILSDRAFGRFFQPRGDESGEAQTGKQWIYCSLGEAQSGNIDQGFDQLIPVTLFVGQSVKNGDFEHALSHLDSPIIKKIFHNLYCVMTATLQCMIDNKFNCSKFLLKKKTAEVPGLFSTEHFQDDKRETFPLKQ